jgi:hypothetical protein
MDQLFGRNHYSAGEISRLRRVLKHLDSIPETKRPEELADIRADTVRALLRDQERDNRT